jgi:hypothetical protein
MRDAKIPASTSSYEGLVYTVRVHLIRKRKKWRGWRGWRRHTARDCWNFPYRMRFEASSDEEEAYLVLFR